jgi:hypothetical protein
VSVADFGPVVPPEAVDGGAKTTPIVQVLPAARVPVVVVGQFPGAVVDLRK